jgi:hypothetical protein
MNLVDKLKIVLGLVEAEVKLSEALLEDGTTMVEAESFEVGMPLNMVNADGSYTPATEGDYTLGNGTMLKVDANGVITEVVEPATDAPAASGDTAPVAAATELANETPTVSIDDFNNLVEKIGKLEEALLLSAEAFKTENEELKTKVEKLSAAPAGEPIKSKGVVPVEQNALRGLLKK